MRGCRIVFVLSTKLCKIVLPYILDILNISCQGRLEVFLQIQNTHMLQSIQNISQPFITPVTSQRHFEINYPLEFLQSTLFSSQQTILIKQINKVPLQQHSPKSKSKTIKIHRYEGQYFIHDTIHFSIRCRAGVNIISSACNISCFNNGCCNSLHHSKDIYSHKEINHVKKRFTWHLHKSLEQRMFAFGWQLRYFNFERPHIGRTASKMRK